MIGAALMVATGALAPAEAHRAIDFDTLALLLGMMIVVANLRLAGFFGLCHTLIASRAHHAAMLLIGVTAIAGTL
jgi:Na+/H+ antiporter NhaD/arsenite permease-like protein